MSVRARGRPAVHRGRSGDPGSRRPQRPRGGSSRTASPVAQCASAARAGYPFPPEEGAIPKERIRQQWPGPGRLRAGTRVLRVQRTVPSRRAVARPTTPRRLALVRADVEQRAPPVEEYDVLTIESTLWTSAGSGSWKGTSETTAGRRRPRDRRAGERAIAQMKADRVISGAPPLDGSGDDLGRAPAHTPRRHQALATVAAGDDQDNPIGIRDDGNHRVGSDS